MAAKKKRPPKQVWIVFYDGPVWNSEVFTRKKHAGRELAEGHEVTGPYVLAERVRQR